jgi:hypothetical protein
LDEGTDESTPKATTTASVRIQGSSITHLVVPYQSCEEFYIASGKSKTVLLAMAQGVDMVDNDINEEPYKSAKNRHSFVPQAKDLCDEILCRSQAYGLVGAKTPRPKAWTHQKKIEWLTANKLMQGSCIMFVQREVDNFVQLLRSAGLERQQEEELHRGNEAWLGQEPYLRLYHVIMEDDVKEAYSKAFNVMTRAELDARNSSERPRGFYKLASERYNNYSYNPWTTTYPDLHDDFRRSIRLGREDAPTTTPVKIKEKLADVRAKLVIMVSNWERSGNGNGNRADNDNLEDGDVRLQDDDRRNFLGTYKPHLLYFWQKLEEVFLCALQLQRLKKERLISWM